MAEAERLYRNILSIDPRHVESLHYLGVVALQSGHVADAVDLIGKSLELSDRNADAHYHRGLAFAVLGRFEETVAHFRHATALAPDYADAHLNLAKALQELGQLTDAVASFRRVVTLLPNNAEAHLHLADILVENGDLDAAVAAYERAIAVRPNYPEAQHNLGTALLLLGRTDDALARYRAALLAKPDFVDAFVSQALALVRKGDYAEAMAELCRALDLKPTDQAKGLFVQCATCLEHCPDIAHLIRHLVAALTEPWGRPNNLARFAALSLKSKGVVATVVTAVAATQQTTYQLTTAEIAAMGGDTLLLALLESAPISDIQLEALLTAARRKLLDMAAADADDASDTVLALACALARQCFVNEYVFDFTEDEAGLAHRLCERLTVVLGRETSFSPILLAIVAAYKPLHAIPEIERWLVHPWPMSIDAILTQQVREPQNRTNLSDSIPCLTAIDDAVSLAVQRQYEENPYPRWVKVARGQKARSFDHYLRQRFPNAPVSERGKSDVDILIAGCGTGQFLVELAQELPAARIFAVDLSRASLSYAKSKAHEYKLANIEFAQADLLRLADIERMFDFVDAGGVLHHTADPFSAWAVLLKLVRPGGFMQLGLYSELARHGIASARALIAAQGFPASADGIRRARSAIKRLPDESPAKRTTISSDFFSTSECRDLLFHVQEQRLTIPQIKAFIAEHGLTFLGFRIDTRTINQYRARFTQDRPMTDLDCWHTFEVDNPETFIGMYQFAIQKPA